MAGSDDTAAEGKDRPIGDDDAGLRQRVEERAGQPECDLAKPNASGGPR